MKRILFFTVLFLTLQSVFAQKNDNLYSDGPIFYDVVEVRPEFPGGSNEFMKFIGKNFMMPEYSGNEGVVKVSFIIETNGSISNVEIVKDLGEGTGNEAKRVISLSPKWTPGEQGGKKVRVIYEFSIKIVGQG